MADETICLSLTAWAEIVNPATHKNIVANILPAYLLQRRWFAGKNNRIDNVKIVAQTVVASNPMSSILWLLEVSYNDHVPERYLLPVCFIGDREMPEEQMRPPVLCKANVGLATGWLCDATWCDSFRMALFRNFAAQSTIRQGDEYLVFSTAQSFHKLGKDIETSGLLHAEQSNSSITFGKKLFLKMYRKVEAGINSETEVSKFLSQEASFMRMPAWLGEIQWQTSVGRIAVAVLQEMMPGATSGWDQFRQLAREVLKDPNSDAHDQLWNEIEELGRLTAAMHIALSSRNDIDDFKVERYSENEQREFRESVLAQVPETFEMLRQSLHKIPDNGRSFAEHFLDSQQELSGIIREIHLFGGSAVKIRIHGDYHLGQILRSDNHTMVTDFEGEPGRSLDERRQRQPAVKDLAGMIRSFQYLAFTAVMSDDYEGGKNIDDRIFHVESFVERIEETFLRSYNASVQTNVLSRNDPENFSALLQLFLIDKALYELRYELNNRPAWAVVPIAGLTMMIRKWMESSLPQD